MSFISTLQAPKEVKFTCETPEYIEATKAKKELYREEKILIQKKIMQDMLDKLTDTIEFPNDELGNLEKRYDKYKFNLREMRDKIGDHLSKRGFIDIASHWMIKLSNENIEEEADGYFSDGWESECRASKMKEKLKLRINEVYKVLIETINQEIARNPNYIGYEFKTERKNVNRKIEQWLQTACSANGYFYHTSFYPPTRTHDYTHLLIRIVNCSADNAYINWQNNERVYKTEIIMSSTALENK